MGIPLSATSRDTVPSAMPVTQRVQYLFVAPIYRRRRIATTLLRLLAAWFREQGAVKVCVNVDAESPAAVPFYTSQGASALNKHWYAWANIGTVIRAVRS